MKKQAVTDNAYISMADADIETIRAGLCAEQAKVTELVEVLRRCIPRLAPYGEQDWIDARAAIAKYGSAA